MLATVSVAVALVLAAPAAVRSGRAEPNAVHGQRRPAPPKGASRLDRARALLAQVKRDPAKRRYRHHWERAIGALEKSARGRDRAPALLEAARARYALYRFSQVDADRGAALRLAERAQRAGARDAAAFTAAVRREMGEDEEAAPASQVARRTPPPRPAPAPAPRPSPRDAAAAAAAASPSPSPDAGSDATASAPAAPARQDASTDEEAPTDPVLDKALRAAAEPATGPAEPASVTDVRSWSNSDYTRVAVYLSRNVGFTQEEIPADGGRPRRLALDLKPALLARGLAHPVDDALVQRVRAAQRTPDTVRVVLDLAGRDDLMLFSLDDPPRLIVDVGVREARRDARASTLREGAGELSPRRPIRRVVVDAGHGGHDTGAIGPTGVREKDVTLAMARRLARQLQARGFEVVLTRRDDKFVPLEERTAIANARHGDLFVSLHANAHPHRDRRGVETYVLNMADDRYAARLAARENGALTDDAEPQDVRRILSDLDAKSSVDASRRLAQAVQRQLCGGIRGRVGEVRDLGVKSALFHVLVGARMPAVLVETSFISNRSEEKRLRSPRFQDEVASAVAGAVQGFAMRESRLASAR
jgi:N-acetylmuramoyl-L-alanine amidase